MDPSGIAAERDVAGQFVDLVAEGEISAAPRFQRRAVCPGLDRVRQDVIRIEEGFQDRGAGPRIASVSRGVRGVSRTSLGKGDGQQPAPML
jgi:hypothetical protein